MNPILVDRSLTSFMQLDQIAPLVDGEAIYTWPLLQEWWKIYLRMNNRIGAEGHIYPDPNMIQLLRRDFTMHRDRGLSKQRLNWNDLLLLLQEHVDTYTPIHLTPDIIEWLQQQMVDLTTLQMELFSI